MTCIFCDIAARALSATVVAESELCLAFLDINPFAIGHTLIIPKQHISDLPEVPDATLTAMMLMARELSQSLRGSQLHDGIKCTGTTLYMADGVGAQPHVPHLHLHVIPRYVGDAERWQEWLAELPMD
jgi:histidine triad (HIT) family protein